MHYARKINHALAAACLATMFSTMAFAEGTAELVGVLTSDASVFDKAKACQRLSIVGDESAVPMLARLLGDEKLSNYARCALEGIPGPAPDAALRGALSRFEGERLIGVLGSIGVRRDAKAIDSVAKLLDSDDRATAEAAARTLGYIGTLESARVLRGEVSEITLLRPAVANACLICARCLTEQGETEQAVSLCDAVGEADVPEHVALAASYDAILALGNDGLPRLVEQLESDDPARFRLALQAARMLDIDASAALVAQFKTQTPERQALLLIALGDLGSKASLPTVVEAAGSGEPEVRVQAIRTLAQLGDSSVIPVLLQGATQSDPRIAEAARSTLAVLQSGEINTAIVAMLDSGDSKTVALAVDMASQRKIASAAPALLRLAQSNDTTVRPAAIGALGSTAAIDDLPKFIDLAIGTLGSEEFATAAPAFKAACVRMPQEACAAELTAAMSGTSTVAKVFLLEQLTAIGGTTALKTVSAAARNNDGAIQDAATRLLGEWLTADAAPVMLDLAKTLDSDKYKVRALRGYVRIARQLNMTSEQRMAVCRNTLAIAGRDADRLLVFEVLRRYPTPEGLALAESCLGDDALRGPACSTLVAMAPLVAIRSPEETEKALRRVLDLTTDETLRQEAEKQIAKAREFAEQLREEADFTPLFNGADLEDWQCSPGVFRVQDGAIVGGNLEKPIGSGNDFACTKEEYGDFELRLEFKLLGNNPNGGVNVRSRRISGSGVAAGYQADLGANWWGCLYDEARRGRVIAASMVVPREKPVRIGDWNDYRIRCEGKRIQLWINGIQTVDYTEEEANIPLRGIIALQIQPSRPSEAWYRNIRIRTF
ncbi:MAG: DUF1080 domain-containing protein [Thermoguttaceae bacterium]